jgi:hypothetical protein
MNLKGVVKHRSWYISPREKYHLLLFVILPLGVVVVGVLAALVSQIFAPLFFVWMIGIRIALSRIYCPQCGKSVGGYYTLVVGRYCRHCHYDFERANFWPHRPSR